MGSKWGPNLARQPLQRIRKRHLLTPLHIGRSRHLLRRMTKLQRRLSQPQPLIQKSGCRLPEYVPGHPLQLRALQRPHQPVTRRVVGKVEPRPVQTRTRHLHGLLSAASAAPQEQRAAPAGCARFVRLCVRLPALTLNQRAPNRHHARAQVHILPPQAGTLTPPASGAQQNIDQIGQVPRVGAGCG